VAEKGASGDVFDEKSEYAHEGAFDYLLREDEPGGHDGFDAFDEKNWIDVADPAKGPWHRSPQARTLLIASGIAVSAIVISVVLLLVRAPARDDSPSPSSSTTPTTTPVATATSPQPPPPPPPPAPPPPEPSTMERAPVAVQPSETDRPTKSPEIGVTRTPITREPLSVAPAPRGRQRLLPP